MKAQAGADARAYDYMRGRRTLEINPKNPLIQNLLKVAEEKGVDETRETIEFIYHTALIASGFDLENPQNFALSIYALMEKEINRSTISTYPDSTS